jgi:hypothetical protein
MIATHILYGISIVKLLPKLLGQEWAQKHKEGFQEEVWVQHVQFMDVLPQKPRHSAIYLRYHTIPTPCVGVRGDVVTIQQDVAGSLGCVVKCLPHDKHSRATEVKQTPI